jgi:hypothetical protein
MEEATYLRGRDESVSYHEVKIGLRYLGSVTVAGWYENDH